MATVIGISGSLRSQSLNTRLLHAAASLAPEGLIIEIESIASVPLYDGDLEAASGIPEPVQHLKARVAAADGLLLVTPEYNNSIPGVFKNAIDWMSRPARDRIFVDKPTGIIGASPSRYGTLLAQQAWLPVARTLGMRLFTGAALAVGGAPSVFDADTGELVDEVIRGLLVKYLEGFAAFVAASAAR